MKVVAKLATNTTALTDLAFLLDPAGVLFSDETASGFTALSGAVRAEVEGSGLGYTLGVPSPVGTIDRIDIFDSSSGDLLYKMSDMDLDLAVIMATPDILAATALIFSGPDKFKGSNGDDIFAGGGGNDKFVGKDGDDQLFGNDGKDNFDGGKGDDTYDGGKGNDIYVFKDAPDSGVDTIVKLQSAERLRLDGNDFNGLGGSGKLDADFFVVGSKAEDGNDYIIYNDNTGELSFDEDGKGGAHQILFAKLQNHPSSFDADSIIVT